MLRIVKMGQQIYNCPWCGSSNVIAGYEVQGPLILFVAKCNDCNYLKQKVRRR